jgi:hypothetical protein
MSCQLELVESGFIKLYRLRQVQTHTKIKMKLLNFDN